MVARIVEGLGNPFLMLIALFVWIGAGQEAAMTQMKAALGGIPLEQAMTADCRTRCPCVARQT